MCSKFQYWDAIVSILIIYAHSMMQFIKFGQYSLYYRLHFILYTTLFSLQKEVQFNGNILPGAPLTGHALVSPFVSCTLHT